MSIENQCQATARALYTLWKPALVEQSSLYQGDSAGVFPGLVAFMGIQNVLWPEWLRLCAMHGVDVQPKDKAYTLQDDNFHDYSWYTLFLSYSPSTALALTGGLAWPSSTQMSVALRAADVQYSLATMESDGKMLLSGTAREKLTSSGISVSGRDELNIPGITCEALQALWPVWQEMTAPVFPAFDAFVEQCHSDALFTVRYTFAQLADALWREMVADLLFEQHIAKPKTFMQKIGLARTPRLYQGVLLIQGDYENLWETMQQEAV